MKVITLTKKSFKKEVEIAVDALQNGEVIVCPTDTVYGLLADATNRKAVKKVFLIKGRAQGNPLPIFVKNITMAKKLAKVSPLQEKYMSKSWPGKTTLVLKSKGVLAKATGTEEYIGIRIVNHKFIEAIVKKIKTPLTGTSANLTGNPSLLDGKDVIEVFLKRKYRPDIIFNVGELPQSHPSKVIDITAAKPKTLRK
ncbi:MAG: L-threonylcarbamoyladenylate synthase [bacterium]|nr:L-threonylcarbamoyladenylate synthase [bacterium]